MGKKSRAIPEFASWEEGDEFWSTHSLTDLDLEDDRTPSANRTRRFTLCVSAIWPSGWKLSFPPLKLLFVLQQRGLPGLNADGSAMTSTTGRVRVLLDARQDT